MPFPSSPELNTEERVIALLRQFSANPDSHAGEQWIRSFCTISCAYAEYTGGHINLDDLMQVLSEECFT